MSMFLLLISSLALATDAPLNWIKPVDPNLKPSAATVVVLISRTRVDETALNNINKWQADGFLLLDGEQATKGQILAGLNQAKQYGHVILNVDELGIGGDFGDPFVMPYGAVPDDVNGVLRPSEIMKTVQGSQAWVAVISNTMNNEVTSGGKEAFIGPDASQWLDAAAEGSNVFVLTAGTSQNLPSAPCQENFAAMLWGNLATRYATGHDLSFYELAQTAKELTNITIVNVVSGSTVCNFTPEAKYQGSVTPKTVMLIGSGVLPDPVIELQPEFTPVDPTIPKLSVPMTSTLNEVKPKSRLPSVIGFAAGGGCLVGGAVESVLFLNGVKQAKETFASDNLTANFSSEAEMDTAYDAAVTKLSAQGNTAIGLYACAGLGVGLGTTTLFLSGHTVGVTTAF